MTALLLMALTMDTPAADSAVNQPRTFEGTAAVSLDYLLTLPPGYDDAANAETSYPLVLFLHGFGESGDNLDLVKVHGPPKLIEAGQTFPFILVAPQTKIGRWWQPTELLALLDEVEAAHRVDADRVYVTGLSMGGFGTWETAGLASDRFAAAVPICGGGNGVLTAYIGDLPVWAFHGDQDTAVPLALSEYLVERINRKGGNAKLTVYPGVGHDSWTQTYANPELYEWMLRQNRAERIAARESVDETPGE